MKREIFSILNNIIKDKAKTEVIIVEGARQVGKSYLVNDVLKSNKTPFLAFDLEKDIKFRRQINNTEDFNDFITLLNDQYNFKEKKILFIDEAQECNKLKDYIKSFKEDLPHKKVILTGSSMNKLFSKDARIPVGRTRSICIYPFTFIEVLKYLEYKDLHDFILSTPKKISLSRHQYLLNLFDEYLKIGGYPEVVKSYKEKENYYAVLDEIIAGLSEDFERKEEYQPKLFWETLHAIANHIGGPSKYSHINTTKYHAKRVIEAMEKWHIILEVEQYSIMPFKSSFLPKRYLLDIGMVNKLRSIAVPLISLINTIDPFLRTPLGGVFENAVLLNLLEGESAYKEIGTWKKGNNTDIEVDFIFDIPEKRIKIPIECKASLKLYKRHFKNILQYLELTHQHSGIIVSAAPLEKFSISDKTIINIPIYLITKNNIINYILNPNL